MNKAIKGRLRAEKLAVYCSKLRNVLPNYKAPKTNKGEEEGKRGKNFEN